MNNELQVQVRPASWSAAVIPVHICTCMQHCSTGNIGIGGIHGIGTHREPS